MKQFFVAISLLLALNGWTQETINGNLNHDGISRSYILYVPSTYTGNEQVPLVFNFHGYGSNAQEQYFYADFRSVAERENFLIVLPNGTEFNGNQHWDVGGNIFGSGTDDIGFTEALLDEISDNYNIDSKRVYATGMSNGGYLSFHLACQIPNRIAAIASVTGAMTPVSKFNCQINRPFPVLQIHGTQDPVVPYVGANWSVSIPEVLDFWTDNNMAIGTPEIKSIPNTNTFDQSTVEHEIRTGTNGVTVEHFKVIGGEHTWPGAPIPLGVTNQDINACEEIWKFFSRYTLDGLVGINNQFEQQSINLFPIPTFDYLNIQNSSSETSPYKIFSIDGRIKQEGIVSGFLTKVSLGNLPAGIYFIKIRNTTLRFSKQ